MKNIAIIGQSTENADGDVIQRYLFTADVKDTTAPSGRTVSLRPVGVYNRMLRMEQTDNAWQTTGETIMFRMGDIWDNGSRKPIPDSLGGDALGRVFGEEAKALDSKTSEQMKKDSRWYTYLFGEFTFEDGTSVFGNLRLTGGQAADLGKAKLRDDKLADVKVNLKVAPAKQGLRKFDITFEKVDAKPLANFGELEDTMLEYIDTINNKVLEAYQAAAKDTDTTAVLNKAGVKVGKAADLDDEIPF